MNVPSLKVMPKNSASAGKSASDALVSGPRAVIIVLPLKVVITISQLLTAAEVKVPAHSLWVCQIISTKDEFAGLASNTNSMLSPVGMAEPPDQLANLRAARTPPLPPLRRGFSAAHWSPLCGSPLSHCVCSLQTHSSTGL